MAMLLHRYFNSHAFETLKDARLKTSRISSFNDPFEFLFVSVGRVTPDEARKYIRSYRDNPAFLLTVYWFNQLRPSPMTDKEIDSLFDENEPALVADLVKKWPEIVKATEVPLVRRRQIIDEELRAICFSAPSSVKKLDEILLWSHYAKKHEGFRIGFELPDGMKAPFEIVEIKYQENRVHAVFSPGADRAALEALEESAKVKSKAWEYEHEFRLFTKTCHCEPREVKNGGSTSDVEHFLEFKREWVRSVDFGALCPDAEVQHVLDLLKTDYPKNLIRRKAEFHKEEFALEYKGL